MSLMTWPITLPIIVGLLALCLPDKLAKHVKYAAVLVAAVVLAIAIALCAGDREPWTCCGQSVLALDNLGALILVAVAAFGLLITLYSVGFFRPGDVSESSYYGNVLLSLGAACGVALSGNLILLALFWGLLGIPLYLLIQCGSGKCNDAAKKTLLILGGTDSILLLGIAAFAVSTGGWRNGGLNLFQGPVAVAGLAGWFGAGCLIIAALAKAGAMPFHTWVPDACETAPSPAVAFLPASLDKLLGIYLLARVFLTLYDIPMGHGLRITCMLVGAATIVFAVMAAMIQHKLRRLLGFHAVSQVGYMVVGVSCGAPIGVAGGLFHMLNHAIYKSCLFLTAGAAERKTGETELDKMGGLAKAMPLTFVAGLASAFAISGVPPLNGFASKWMVYRGILASSGSVGFTWVIVLVAAMFGSALTLASFVKVLHSVFLGQPKKPVEHGPNPTLSMKIPMAVLGAACIVLGIWATQLAVGEMILPGLPAAMQTGLDTLVWKPGLATVLIIAALVGGLVIYLISTFANVREDESYVGGEVGARAEMYNFEGTEFYKTVGEMPFLKAWYQQAEAKWYDLYDQLRRATFYVTGWLRRAHDGVLHTYVTWCVVGLLVILWWLLYSYRILGRAF